MPRRFAVLGWPVAHSLSPPMQNAAFAALGMTAGYECIAVPPAALGRVLAELRDAGYEGWNVTVPHKAAVLAHLDEVDPAAAAAGSVNTVCNRGGVLHGTSTDGYGLAAAVQEQFEFGIGGRRVAFVGAGGAARAAAVHIAGAGVSELLLLNRTLSKAEQIAVAIRAVAPACQVRCAPLAAAGELAGFLAAADLVVQATSLGLHPGDPLPLNPDLLAPDTCVLDMIYQPTPFLRRARRRRCRTADGRGMLLHQGARSFTLWTGRPAPVEVMRQALEEALARRAQAAVADTGTGTGP